MRIAVSLIAALFLVGGVGLTAAGAQTKDQTEQAMPDKGDGNKGDGGGGGGGAPPPTLGPITGVWGVVGANARGQTYRGRVAVRRVGDVYRVIWRIGRSTYAGVGIRTGNILSVAYNGGLAVYRITPRGLVGQWTTTRGTRILSENWQK